MLELKNISKIYELGKTKDKDYQKIEALDSVSIKFRKNEFVSILGPSGCGKTTMLNIIGGLDKYTSGDLLINNVSTKQYQDKDWDNYRNNRIGFVFQSYNLIPHQTVLENVELALTLSGVKRAERRERAIKVLQKVGLGDKIKSKPNQLSGGQMQRVAIARALVNNPEVILADEPTGALDTKTSLQIMELLEEVAKEKLVIMVTHNADLANQYSTRIINMLDGKLTGDSNPISEEEEKELIALANEEKLKEEQLNQELANLSKKERKEKLKQIKKSEKKKKKKMSFFTALSLSFKNLLTKKARTILVSFAGSIGIIGIAMILSLSSGFQIYIDTVQKDTLSNYPITIAQSSTDYSKILESVAGDNEDVEYDKDKVYSNNSLSDMMQVLMSGKTENDLKSFKKYIETAEVQEKLKNKATVKYTYDLDLNIFYDNAVGVDSGKSLLVSPFSLLSNMSGNSPAMSLMNDIFQEMLNNQTLIQSQYNLVAGSWAQTEVYDSVDGKVSEVMIVLDQYNRIPDYALMALGLRSRKDIDRIMSNQEITDNFELSAEELLGLEYSLVLNPDMYSFNAGTGLYERITSNSSTNQYYTIETANKTTIADLTSVKLKVVGVIKPDENATATAISGTVAYGAALTEYVVNELEQKAGTAGNALYAQKLNSKSSVISGKYFDFGAADIVQYYNSNQAEKDLLTSQEKTVLSDYETAFSNWVADQSNQAAMLALYNAGKTVEETFSEKFQDKIEPLSLDQTLQKLGSVNLDNPETISFYAVDFEAKNDIEQLILDYNNQVLADESLGTLGDRQKIVISYTDYVGLMMESVTIIINAITYVLIAFVSISLVVSSIMIGIITYISVLERTKEIGVLRSVGASKKDIKRVFTAESLIIGFASGALGILITLILNIPINLIIEALAGIAGVSKLPVVGGFALVVVSMFLTFIAGLIPAKIASKKDPVIALRSE